MTTWAGDFSTRARGRVLLDEPMSRRCSYKVGGPADAMFFPAGPEDLEAGCVWLRDRSIPFIVLGSGTNVLPPDEGLRGAAVRLTDGFSGLEIHGERVRSGAGRSLIGLVREVGRRGLSGLESLAGVPGTVGGAVWMNAGAFGGEIGERIARVRVWRPGSGVLDLDRSQLEFSYRESGFQKGEDVILETELELTRDDPAAISRRMEAVDEKRVATQPHDRASAGSVFRNPPGQFAGALIDRAGLKGAREGGAVVSERHANFIVNEGGATARDILTLIEKAREAVFREFNVRLELEVRVLKSPALSR